MSEKDCWKMKRESSGIPLALETHLIFVSFVPLHDFSTLKIVDQNVEVRVDHRQSLRFIPVWIDREAAKPGNRNQSVINPLELPQTPSLVLQLQNFDFRINLTFWRDMNDFRHRTVDQPIVWRAEEDRLHEPVGIWWNHELVHG
jgi:hypothetical protein